MLFVLKDKFGQTSLTRLLMLSLKFNPYKMHSNRIIKQHLRMMSTMICKLKVIGKNLTDEQLV